MSCTVSPLSSYSSISLYCGNPIQYRLEKNDTEIRIPELKFGYINFNNILTSTFSIFQVLTMEGWSDFVLMVFPNNILIL